VSFETLVLAERGRAPQDEGGFDSERAVLDFILHFILAILAPIV